MKFFPTFEINHKTTLHMEKYHIMEKCIFINCTPDVGEALLSESDISCPVFPGVLFPGDFHEIIYSLFLFGGGPIDGTSAQGTCPEFWACMLDTSALCSEEEHPDPLWSSVHQCPVCRHVQ